MNGPVPYPTVKDFRVPFGTEPINQPLRAERAPRVRHQKQTLHTVITGRKDVMIKLGVGIDIFFLSRLILELI